MTRKRRFGDGGDVVGNTAEDANDNIQARANRGESAKSEKYKAEPGQVSTGLKRETFSDAFARARRMGDKTFEFGGKKYTTETKSPKAKEPEAKVSEPASKVEAKTETKSESKTNPAIAAGLGAAGLGLGAAALLSGMRKSEQNRKERELAKGREERSTRSPVRNITPEESAWEGEGGRAMKKGGKVKKYASGGSVSSASKRADGCAMRGKTRGKMY